jgi:DNA-binding LytR/AlgR family response regulator
MIRIALCDDQKSFLELEKRMIEHHLSEKAIEFQCDTYISGEGLLSLGEEICKYNLFILDYEMDGLTGFETAREIYGIYPNAKIAFATNYYDFTREGYKYSAVRYLVKQEETFNAELVECIEFILKTEPSKNILLELSDGNLEVAIDDIAYIKSEKHYIEYFVKEKDSTFYIRRCSLDDALKELPEYFIRAHQRYIINLKNSVQLRRYEVIIKKSEKGTIKIPIARNRFDDVNRKFCLVKGEIG